MCEKHLRCSINISKYFYKIIIIIITIILGKEIGGNMAE